MKRAPPHVHHFPSMVADNDVAAVTQTMECRRKGWTIPPVCAFMLCEFAKPHFIKPMMPEKIAHGTNRIISPLVPAHQCGKITAVRYPQWCTSLVFKPPCLTDMIGMGMRHDLFDKPVCRQTVFPSATSDFPCCPCIDRTPSILISQKPDIDVIQYVR